MLDWNDFKIVFGDIDPNRVVSIFPTVSIFLEFGIGERDESEDLKFNFLKQARHVSNAEYLDYRIKNPEDLESKGIQLMYQNWIDNILIELQNKISLSNEKNVKLKVVKRNQPNITHEEVVIALNYLVKNLKENSDLHLTDIVRLLYYLRKEEIPNKIEYTAEYTQYSKFINNTSTGADQNRKNKNLKVSQFFKSIGLLDIGSKIFKDFN